MNKFYIYISILLMTLFTGNPVNAQTTLSAGQVAQKATALITGSKGLTAKFTISGNGQNGSGIIKSSGSKFKVDLPNVKIWYNGKDLYTYNLNTKETTVVKPDAQELLDSNPLLYLKGGGGSYNYNFSKQKINGKYLVELTPRNSKNEIKKMTFTVNSKNFKTEKIVVTTGSGTITVTVNELKTDENLSASEFEYPKSKYPDAEIVDLR